MSWMSNMPVWALALLVFGLRICDVSFGTMRTLAVVQGRVSLSVALGFFEVLIWVIGVSQVMSGLQRSPVLALAYAAGFACGNAVGITIERYLALGSVVVRLISARCGEQIAETLRRQGHRLTTFEGMGRDGPVLLLYITVRRREMNRVLQAARELDPFLFYTIESLRERSSEFLSPLPHATGWRSFHKQK